MRLDFKQFVERLKERRVLRVAVAYIAIVWVIAEVTSTILPALGLPPWSLRFFLSAAILAFPIVIVVAWSFNVTHRQEIRVHTYELKAEEELDFPSFFQTRLQIVAERARLLMVKAETRANMMFVVGTAFAIFSVLAPFVSIAVYVNTDPLPASVLERIDNLRGPDGTLPDGLSLSVAKDWRVLISGISFGFLFLAAASALYTQHRRQMDTVFRLGKDVGYFDSVVNAAEIRRKMGTETVPAELSDLVDEVLTELIRRPPDSDRIEPYSDQHETPLKQLAELMKQLKN